MSNTLYESTGIKLTKAQSQLFVHALRTVIVMAILAVIAAAASFAFDIVSPRCLVDLVNQPGNMSADNCVNYSNELSALIVPILAVIFWVPLISLVVHAINYFVKLLKPEFREKEMAESVNYLENDEREQLVTMKATRRAYMVLNFTLLAFWIFSLFGGNFGTAFTLFIVQSIGAISYKRQIEK